MSVNGTQIQSIVEGQLNDSERPATKD